MKCKDDQIEIEKLKKAIILADARLAYAEGIGLLTNMHVDDAGYSELKEVLNYEM